MFRRANRQRAATRLRRRYMREDQLDAAAFHMKHVIRYPHYCRRCEAWTVDESTRACRTCGGAETLLNNSAA